MRGRNPTGFVVLTVCFWIGFEIAGFFLGTAAGAEVYAVFVALLSAALGGFFSYLITCNCTPGYYSAQQQSLQLQWNAYMMQNLQPLLTPAQVTLVMDGGMDDAQARWDFMLNGQPIGSLENGTYTIAPTMQRCNVLIAKDAKLTEIPPYIFDVADGSHVEIRFINHQFVPTSGVLPSTVVQPVQQQTYGQPVSPYSSQPQTRICVRCGAPNDEDAVFCQNCGVRIS